MPRTIVYPTVRGGPFSAGDGDDYLGKVGKYIPGEVLAFVVPVVANLKETNVQELTWTFWIGLIATPLYMAYAASRAPADKKPKPHFYVLATVAYVIWALVGFDKIGGAFGYDLSTARIVILPAWVLLAPIADWAVESVLKKIFPNYP